MIAASQFADFLDIAIHLDHAKQMDSVKLALESQFTSVMFDGSQLSLEDNIQASKNDICLVCAFGASVEAELGYLNNEDGSGSANYQSGYTRVFVEETNVDALAVAIGNAHGLYKGVPHLDFSRLKALSQAVKIPLVLHGASGIPPEQIQKAISFGIAKINVNTEVALSGARAIQNRIADQQHPRLEQLMLAARSEMQHTIGRYLVFLGY